ncbi:MAG: hypothetical protein HY362_00010 [Candidatus Aenigmarchaeota archaeon]|nr:hypothetical protein [Candidatus Aenigmarchaeota archaeon]
MDKSVFYLTAIISVAVFVAGLFVGIWIDDQRLEETRGKITGIDIEWNDARLQNLFFQTALAGDDSCNSLIGGNLQFSDKVYKQGLEIERFESVNKFTPQLLEEKRRYALLQMQFWLNSVQLKRACNATYSTVVYFYSQYNESSAVDQRLQSTVLSELKNKCGNKIMLIPLPTDLDIVSVNQIKDTYGIKSTPSILVNEKDILTGVKTLGELEGFVKC